MSRLRELRLHGFKSFADPTRFVFERGVNAVIGPNGSGKSNMADAVRWVLGEQSNRSLRTRRSDDVIFGGSDARRPQGMAEAILTLDNGDGWLPIDYAEVSIGRRAYRSGESEYLINGARARLKDVVELLGEGRLGANELVVVGQGTVDAALSLRPEERRQLFEEAAGVKGLQVRRNEASARLGRSRDNLTRVNDLISELKPQVRRLALQAEHQQQHDALGHRARALVHASHDRRERAARSALGEARRAAAAAEAALDAYREEQEAGRAAQVEAERRYWAAEEAARDLAGRRQAAREELIRLEGRHDALLGRERELAAAIERGDAELAALATEASRASPADATAEVDPAIRAAEEAEARWRAAVAALAAADEELLHAEQAAAELRERYSDRIATRARMDEARERHAMRLGHAEADAADARSAVADHERRLREARDAAARADAARHAALDRLEELGRQRDAAQEEADAIRGRAIEATERLRAARAELAALAEPHDAGRRLGRRLADAGWRTLLDGLDAPEASWPAIEAVVGAELDATLLWDAEGDPRAALDDARGTARLLVGGSVDDAERARALAAVDADRSVADWIGLDHAPSILAHAVVAPSVEALLGGWQSLPVGWVAVTAEGDVADRAGISLRGRGEPPGAASVRTHLRRRELTAAIAGMEAETRDAEAAAHASTEALRARRAEHLSAREEHDAVERTARVARESMEAAEAAHRRSVERLARAESDLATVRAEAPATHGDDETPAGPDGLDDVQERAERARAAREGAVRERDEAQAAWNETRQRAEEIQQRTAGARQARLEAEGRLVQLRRSLPEQRAELERLAAERASQEPRLAETRATVAEIEIAVGDAERSRDEQRRGLQELETRVGGSARLGELERTAQASAIEASRRDEGLAALLREREMALETLPEPEAGTEPDGGLDDEIAALDDDALDAELRRVRRTLVQIGSVNPFAVEEHAELSGRLEEMSSQDADLRSAIGSTEELIATLDAEITAQFDRAFRAIGEKFDEYCQLLFAGGSASLQLADEADGDAPGGIEIVVRPPGKRLQRLAMLSGGERALTGVALLFAMLTVNPVPFCILDEVDAALDEANIGRFADALRRLSDAIDFVVITHNRATIEVADTIYGVTMTDAAVSRVLSLRLADVPVEVSA